MTRYIVGRLLQGIVTLFLLITGIYFFTQAIMPGDFVSNFVLNLTPQQAAEWRIQLGLDLPLWQQYLNWLRQLANFDLGRSFYGYEVIEGIRNSAPPTLFVFVLGLLTSFVIGQWLGRVTAWRGPGFLSDSVTFTAITFYAFFPPALAFFMRQFFTKVVVIYPPSTDPFWAEFENAFVIPPELVIEKMAILLGVTFLLILVLNIAVNILAHRRITTLVNVALFVTIWVSGWVVTGLFTMALRSLFLALVPIITFILLSTGEILVITRTSMRDTLHEEYIQTARAKGLKESTIRDKHAARNALLPILSKLVISLPYLLGGLAIIEFAVEWPGMGARLFRAVQQQDMPMILGYLIVIGGLTMASRLLLEILYAILDPRIRFATSPVSR